MNKEKLQMKKNEATGLEMARQSLGRVKEIDFTPEQKEEVMRIIKSAKAEEKAGNLVKALKIYQELKKYLEDFSPEKMEFKQKQIDKIEAIIKKTEEDKTLRQWDRDHLLSELKQQIAVIKKKEKDKLSLYKGDYLKDIKYFKIDEVLESLEAITGVKAEDLFVRNITRNMDDNNILRITFEFVGDPYIQYNFISAGQGVGFSQTQLLKNDRKNFRGTFGETFARWDDEKEQWFDNKWQPIDIE